MQPDLTAIARQQDGLVTRAQCLEHGVTRAALRHVLRSQRRWQTIVPGVYTTFTGPLQERHRVRAALLYAGPAAVITGSYACRAYGMTYAPRTKVIHILVPIHVLRAAIDIATITRARSMPSARTVRGIPCAAPERAALDAARIGANLRDVRAVLCEVIQRGLTLPDRLVAELGSVDPRGMARARHAIDDIHAGCRSAPECEFRDLVLTSTVLPEPVWNQPLPEAPDLIPDAYIEELRLAFEVESLEHHQLGEAPELTERRRARYASLGWRVYPVSPRRIREEPPVVLAEIEAAGLAELPDFWQPPNFMDNAA